MGCTPPPLRNNYARHDTTTLTDVSAHTCADTNTWTRLCGHTRTRMYVHVDTPTHPHTRAHSHTYAQLRRVRAILFRGGEAPAEECAFLVRATPIGHDGITRATPP